MPAEVNILAWSAYCEECDWESERYGYRKGAENEANLHNDNLHQEEE